MICYIRIYISSCDLILVPDSTDKEVVVAVECFVTAIDPATDRFVGAPGSTSPTPWSTHRSSSPTQHSSMYPRCTLLALEGVTTSSYPTPIVYQLGSSPWFDTSIANVRSPPCYPPLGSCFVMSY